MKSDVSEMLSSHYTKQYKAYFF